MLRRFVLSAFVVAALMASVVARVGGAAPTAAALTLNVTPNPIFSGDGVLVYGRLSGPGHGGAMVSLHERVNPATTFRVEVVTMTNTSGFYEFVLPVGAVATNRSWFVSGPGGSRSRTAHERVAAVVTLGASAGTAETSHPLIFSGQVDPASVHSGEHVSLQEAIGSSASGWKTIGRATIGATSGYSIAHQFHTPGAYDLRVLFAGDAQSVAASSDPLGEVVEQAEHPTFTISASNPGIAAGQTVTISGVLHAPRSTSTPLGGEIVTLWGHTYGAAFASIASTTTGSDGGYSFTQIPSRDGSYQVRTTSRQTASLYEAVHAVVTLSASSTSSKVGASVTVSGSVTPNQAGDVIDLEQMGTHGQFHTVRSGAVDGSSAYAFKLRFGSPGTQTFKAVARGNYANASGTSPATAITVALPPVEALPTLCVVCINRVPPIPVPPTTAPTATVVTVTAGVPMTFSFRLSTVAQPKVVSDRPAIELTVPTGDVTFNVTDSSGAILSHTFEVCTTRLPGPVKTLAAIQALPDGCSGTTAPRSPKVLAPGTSATMTIHFSSPGTYEYLSTVGGAATGDAFAGMKGVLNIT